MAVSKECRSGSPCSFWSIVSERFCTLPLWQTHIFNGWVPCLSVVPGFSPLQAIGRHVQVALTRAPLFILLHQKGAQLLHQQGAQQADGRFPIREDADDALAPTHLFVEPLVPIGGAQPLAIRSGQGQYGGSSVKAALQRGESGGSLLLVVGDDLR